MLTSVLLKVARIFAIPTAMFLAPLALMIFLPARSSAKSSAAVGAAATGAPASPGLGASAVAAEAAAHSAGGGRFLGGLFCLFRFFRSSLGRLFSRTFRLFFLRRRFLFFVSHMLSETG